MSVARRRFAAERARAAGAFALVGAFLAGGSALALWALLVRSGEPAIDERLGARLFPLAALTALGVLLAAAPLFPIVSFEERRRRSALLESGAPVWRRLGRELAPGAAALGAATAVFAASSAVALLTLGGVSFTRLASVAFLLLGFAGVALLLGIFVALVGADELSAALCAYAVLGLAAAGPVVAGPWIRVSGNASYVPPAIDVLLLASPVVVVGSAAGLDLLRTDILYKSTPIGQRRFRYPDAKTAVATWAVAAALLSAGSLLKWSRLS